MTPRWEIWAPTAGAGHPDPLVDRLTVLAGVGRVAVLGRPEGRGAPRALVWPESSETASRVLRALAEGGVPSLVVATPPPFDPPDVADAVVYLCLERMAALLAVDETSLVATLQAGITWGRAEALLNRRGLTLGPVPAPLRGRTVAASVATNDRLRPSPACGQLLDALQGVTAVLPDGALARTVAAPRRATGPELSATLLGTAHRAGLVTEVAIQVWRRSAESARRACAVRDWTAAETFVRETLRAGVRPDFVLATGRGPVELAFEVSSAANLRALEARMAAASTLPRSRHDALDALLRPEAGEGDGTTLAVVAVVPSGGLAEAAALLPDAICPDLGGAYATLWAARPAEAAVVHRLRAMGGRVPGLPSGFESLEATLLGHLAGRR